VLAQACAGCTAPRAPRGHAACVRGSGLRIAPGEQVPSPACCAAVVFPDRLPPMIVPPVSRVVVPPAHLCITMIEVGSGGRRWRWRWRAGWRGPAGAGWRRRAACRARLPGAWRGLFRFSRRAGWSGSRCAESSCVRWPRGAAPRGCSRGRALCAVRWAACSPHLPACPSCCPFPQPLLPAVSRCF